VARRTPVRPITALAPPPAVEPAPPGDAGRDGSAPARDGAGSAPERRGGSGTTGANVGTTASIVSAIGSDLGGGASDLGGAGSDLGGAGSDLGRADLARVVDFPPGVAARPRTAGPVPARPGPSQSDAAADQPGETDAGLPDDLYLLGCGIERLLREEARRHGLTL
jgi:hypothetical protein